MEAIIPNRAWFLGVRQSLMRESIRANSTSDNTRKTGAFGHDTRRKNSALRLRLYEAPTKRAGITLPVRQYVMVNSITEMLMPNRNCTSRIKFQFNPHTARSKGYTGVRLP